jgi:hypothetical protein
VAEAAGRADRPSRVRDDLARLADDLLGRKAVVVGHVVSSSAIQPNRPET